MLTCTLDILLEGKMLSFLLLLVLVINGANGSCINFLEPWDVYGISECSPATLPDLVAVDLDNCGLTDVDLADVDACFTAIGRANIRVIFMIGNSGLTTLTADLFREMPALETIYLDESGITTLPPGLFAGTPSLRAVFLSDSRLESLPSGVFDGATSLERLWLRTNSIAELGPGLFDTTLSLTTIHLGENRLTTFPAGLFQKLGRAENLPTGATTLNVYLRDNDLQCKPATCAECSVTFIYDDQFWEPLDMCDALTPPPTPAPVVVEPEPECSNGIVGFEGKNDKGSVCCPLGCTRCGGAGCRKFGSAEGLGGEACCVTGVLKTQDRCSVTGTAPCKIEG